jgi:hypothetical protein
VGALRVAGTRFAQRRRSGARAALLALALAPAGCAGDQPGCHGGVDQARQSCPETFEETGATTSLCAPTTDEIRRAGDCGSFKVFLREWGTHRIVCYYAATSGQLRGAYLQNDTPSFCGQTSGGIVLGPIDPRETCWRSSLAPIPGCP